MRTRGKDYGDCRSGTKRRRLQPTEEAIYNSTQSPLLLLPQEVLVNIVEYLDPFSRINLSRVCFKLHKEFSLPFSAVRARTVPDAIRKGKEIRTSRRSRMVKVLDLSGSEIDKDLSFFTNCRHLVTVNLRGCRISNLNLLRLIQKLFVDYRKTITIVPIEKLDISDCPNLTSETLEDIAKNLPSLTHLAFGVTEDNPKVVSQENTNSLVQGCPQLRCLSLLNIEFISSITSQVSGIIASLSGLSELHTLKLQDCFLNSTQGPVIPAIPKLRHLEVIISGSKSHYRCIQISEIFNSELLGCTSLKTLNLSGSLLHRVPSTTSLSRRENTETLGFLPLSVESLILQGCSVIRDKNLEQLGKEYTCLGFLDLTETGVTPEGIANFCQMHPNCKVIHQTQMPFETGSRPVSFVDKLSHEATPGKGREQ